MKLMLSLVFVIDQCLSVEIRTLITYCAQVVNIFCQIFNDNNFLKLHCTLKLTSKDRMLPMLEIPKIEIYRYVVIERLNISFFVEAKNLVVRSL